MSTTDLIGYFSAFLTTFAFVPQAYLMEDKGFNRCFSADVQHGVLGWIIYGALIAIWPIIMANSVTLVLACAVLCLKLNTAKFIVVPTHGCSPLYISVRKSVIRAGIARIQATWTYLSLPPWHWIPASRRV